MTPGNIHDSVAFDDSRVLATAYKRPQTMKGGYEWWKYVYDEYYDCVLCPEYQPLRYATTNRDGYREYKSDPRICANCPTRQLCTQSKDCVKTVQRHIWKDYEKLADDARYTPKYRNLYARRKETIERVFADAKEKHAMRYTQYRGLTQVTNWGKLKFAAMNLKKLANWKWRESARLLFVPLFSPIYAQKAGVSLPSFFISNRTAFCTAVPGRWALPHEHSFRPASPWQHRRQRHPPKMR